MLSQLRLIKTIRQRCIIKGFSTERSRATHFFKKLFQTVRHFFPTSCCTLPIILNNLTSSVNLKIQVFFPGAVSERGLRRKIAEPFKTVPCFLHPLQGALGKVVQEQKKTGLFLLQLAAGFLAKGRPFFPFSPAHFPSSPSSFPFFSCPFLPS